MKLVTFAAPLLLLGAVTQSSRADNVLLFGDHAGRERIATLLSADGHTTTTAEQMPQRLDGYDVVWHLGAVAALTDAEQKLLAEFVAAGGGAYLTGEGPGTEAMDTSVENIVNATVYKGGLTLDSAPQTSSAPHRFAVGARGDLAVEPNDLYMWDPTVSGAILGASGENVLTTGPDGRVTSAAWAGPEMTTGRGKLIVMMDSGWVVSPYPINRIVQNLELFMRKGVPATCGNAVAEDGEACDDGNTLAGDTCSETCTTETPPSETDDGGDTIDGTGVPVITVDSDSSDDGYTSDESDDLSGGCSTGGRSTSGGVLLLAALSLLITRKRRNA